MSEIENGLVTFGRKETKQTGESQGSMISAQIFAPKVHKNSVLPTRGSHQDSKRSRHRLTRLQQPAVGNPKYANRSKTNGYCCRSKMVKWVKISYK